MPRGLISTDSGIDIVIDDVPDDEEEDITTPVPPVVFGSEDGSLAVIEDDIDETNPGSVKHIGDGDSDYCETELDVDGM